MSDLTQLPMFDPITIKMPRGFETTIDLADADLAQLKWYVAGNIANNNGYVVREIKTGVIRLHIVIMERMINRKLQPKEEVDHIDNNQFNNQRSNLRLATRSQNMGNIRRHKDSKSGYKGVSRHKTSWQAQITVDGKKIYLGIYKTREEAHKAYCDAAVKYFGEFARFE